MSLLEDSGGAAAATGTGTASPAVAARAPPQAARVVDDKKRLRDRARSAAAFDPFLPAAAFVEALFGAPPGFAPQP